MKKVLSFVLVLTLVLGSFSMAFAAAPTDVVGTDWETAVASLVELGVVNGYEDGSYKPAQSVTRAEAAKLVITALGLEEYAAKNTATFLDTQNHWAQGFIGYAEALGLIKGDGNGYFRPNDTVSYQEMATILVRSLGYTDDALPGAWPANYVVRAKAEGIMNGIAQAGNAPANRGDVAVMIYNNLDNRIGYVDKDGLWVAYGNGTTTAPYDTMLGRLSKAVYDYNGDGKIDDNDFFVITENSPIADGVNLMAYYGAYVQAYANAKGKIVGIKEVASTFVKGKFTTSDAIYFVSDNVKYDVTNTDNTTVAGLTNGKSDSDFEISGDAIDTNTEFTLAVDLSGKKIEVYSVSKWTGTNFVWTEDAEKRLNKNMKIGSFSFAENDNKEIDTNSFALLGAASLDAIPEGAIVTVYDKSGITRVEVSTATVEGTVTKTYTNPTQWAIGGKTYSVIGAGITPATDGEFPDVALGAEGTFFLNYAGNIASFEGVEKVTNFAAVVTPAKGYETGGYKVVSEYAIELRLLDGGKKTLTINDNANITLSDGATKTTIEAVLAGEAASVAKNMIVSYSLDKDGNIDSMKLYDNESASGGAYSAKGFINGVQLSNNVVVFVGDGSTLKVGSLSDLPVGETLDDDTTYVVDSKSGKVVAIWTKTSATSSGTFGVLVKYGEVKNSDNKTVYEVTMLVDGNEVTYLTKNNVAEDYAFTDSTSRTALFELTISDGVVSGAVVTDAAVGDGTTTVAAVANGSIKMTGGSFAEVSDSVVVYEIIYKANGSVDKLVASDLASIAAGDIAWLYEVNGKDGHEGYDVIIFAEEK